jgi:monoamine oxidase
VLRTSQPNRNRMKNILQMRRSSETTDLVSSLYIPNRRDVLTAGAFLVNPCLSWPVAATARPKRVIVAGAGLAGLSCAWELSKRGHDVTVLEASNCTGGHVRTIREGFPDDLYADCGAEHFTYPGYELCYQYAKEFGLTLLPYPHRDNQMVLIDGRMISEEDAARVRLSRTQYSPKERRFLQSHPGASLTQLYLDRYGEKITDEYQPFGVGLDSLDHLSLNELLKRDGASAAAVDEIGSDSSALHVIWKRRIVQMRRVPEEPKIFFRVKGGNQNLPDAIAQRLGQRIRKNAPVTAIRRGNAGVAVTIRAAGNLEQIEGDFLVCAMNAAMLSRIAVSPPWPYAKQFAISHMPYTVESRPIFQSRTKFWRRDGLSGNLQFNSPILGPLWPTADEVKTERGILIGTSNPGVTTDQVVTLFRRYYPGASADIDKVLIVDWSREPWAMACEARDYQPGQLHKFWPAAIEPVGRVYFSGAYCDNQSWGMEAATRSALRAARAIHEVGMHE